MKSETDLKLGDVAKDSITGFQGVVVAITHWLNGCIRIALQPQELPHRGPDWRCMTVEEALMARHLAGCTFPIASFDKRFSRSMGALAEAGEITDKQAALLRVKVIRYRRQIPADVVAVAQIGLTQSEPPPA